MFRCLVDALLPKRTFADMFLFLVISVIFVCLFVCFDKQHKIMHDLVITFLIFLARRLCQSVSFSSFVAVSYVSFTSLVAVSSVSFQFILQT